MDEGPEDRAAMKPVRKETYDELVGLLQPFGFTFRTSGKGTEQGEVLIVGFGDREWQVQWSDITSSGAGHVATTLATRAGLSMDARADLIERRRALHRAPRTRPPSAD